MSLRKLSWLLLGLIPLVLHSEAFAATSKNIRIYTCEDVALDQGDPIEAAIKALGDDPKIAALDEKALADGSKLRVLTIYLSDQQISENLQMVLASKTLHKAYKASKIPWADLASWIGRSAVTLGGTALWISPAVATAVLTHNSWVIAQLSATELQGLKVGGYVISSPFALMACFWAFLAVGNVFSPELDPQLSRHEQDELINKALAEIEEAAKRNDDSNRGPINVIVVRPR